jgi:hypothetical protein
MRRRLRNAGAGGLTHITDGVIFRLIPQKIARDGDGYLFRANLVEPASCHQRALGIISRFFARRGAVKCYIVMDIMTVGDQP